MIIVKLWGGLGNQMFQYAAGRRLSLVRDVPIKLDTTWFEKVPKKSTLRHYDLNAFKTVQTRATHSEITQLRGMDITWFPKIVKKFMRANGIFIPKTCIDERHFNFDPRILELSGTAYLNGYWQSEKYFMDVSDTIRSDFGLTCVPSAFSERIADSINNSQSVSIHVRRGDYVSNSAVSSFHGEQRLDYYLASIKHITQNIQSPQFFVFSDDPVWSRENLKFKQPVTYVDHNGPETAYEDLWLMSLCKHHVIANSSFSWWGAWLCRNLEKIIIAPKKWFVDENINTSDLVPETWIRF